MAPKAKKNLPTMIIIAYIILSALFILFIGWRNFTAQYSQASYDAGRRSAIEQIITQANPDTCQAFRVYTEDSDVQLVNLACLSTDDAATTDDASSQAAE